MVVTYNRSKLLSRCVDYLLNQYRKPDEILVINNGSTDDTESVLSEKGIPFITQGNVGGAGGFYTGIEFALSNGFDAVWLMDDDGYPEEKALYTLEKAMKPGISCASSVVLREDNPDFFVFPFTLLDAWGYPVLFRCPRKLPRLSALRRYAKDGTYPFAYLFNGALISLDSIRKIGNTDRSYFIYGDEVDYFFRLRRAGSVISVLDAIHYHPDVSQRIINIDRVYYLIRNSIIIHRKYFNFVGLRNFLVINAILFRVARRNGLMDVMSLLFGSKHKLFYGAIGDGFSYKLSPMAKDGIFEGSDYSET